GLGRFSSLFRRQDGGVRLANVEYTSRGRGHGGRPSTSNIRSRLQGPAHRRCALLSTISLSPPRPPRQPFADRPEAHSTAYDMNVRTPIRNPPDLMYAEFKVHRTMICDRVRTEVFWRAIDLVVRPG